MNRIDTSSHLSRVSDFVLELSQPDGTTTRVCVSVGKQPISLAVFLSLLAQKGVIARGGGNPVRSDALHSEARQRGLLLDIDDGGEYPSHGYEDLNDSLEDPFADSPAERERLNFVIEDGEVCYVAPNNPNKTHSRFEWLAAMPLEEIWQALMDQKKIPGHDKFLRAIAAAGVTKDRESFCEGLMEAVFALTKGGQPALIRDLPLGVAAWYDDVKSAQNAEKPEGHA